MPADHCVAARTGLSGAGKSSTANSLFKERVAKPSVFQEGESKPAVVSRKAAEFVLTVIDTPSLQDAEFVSQPVCTGVAHPVYCASCLDAGATSCINLGPVSESIITS